MSHGVPAGRPHEFSRVGRRVGDHESQGFTGCRSRDAGRAGRPRAFSPSASLAQWRDRRDIRLAEDVGRSITSYARLTIFDDINATVENGMVALTGKVTMPFKKDDIEKRISKIGGVRGMRSDISVLPVSQFDDELRYRVSRAIYSNPSFWNSG